MIKSLTFNQNPSGTGYELRIPSIIGKSFSFHPGLNIIVGRNGSGKTSLLNVIRKLTFCDGMYSSHFSRGHEMFTLHRKKIYNAGYWQNARLVGDFCLSVWNLRKDEDVYVDEWCSTLENAQQRLFGKELSSGQSVYSAIKQMMAYMLYGYGKTNERKIENGREARDFKKCVLDIIENEYEKWKKLGSENNDGWFDMFETMHKYYTENSINGFRGITMLLDEPDRGMDVFNVGEIFDFLARHGDFEESGMQVICVLHNIGLIHRIRSLGKANFIEMSDGYLDKIEDFFAPASDRSAGK